MSDDAMIPHNWGILTDPTQSFLASWVAHSRPVGCPQMTWGRTLENALASKGIPKEFEEWIAIAKDGPEWRQQTHFKPKPSDT